MAGELELFPAGTLTHVLGHQSDGQPRRVAAGLDLRSLAGAAPAATASAGAGQFVSISGTNSLVLPASGTWAYFYVGYSGAGALTTHGAGVGAGGATVASAASTFYGGFAWRQT